MPTWPGTLPDYALKKGYSEQIVPATTLRSPMESGARKRRRRFTTGPKLIRITMPLTDAQITIFQSFYETDLEGGALSFTFTHPRTDASVTVAFREEPKPIVPEGATTYYLEMTLEVLP